MTGTLVSVLDIIEQSATGRVLAHDPATGRTRIVAHGLSFANGIALSSDGHTLLVNETGRYRVWKIDGRADGIDVRPSPYLGGLLTTNTMTSKAAFGADTDPAGFTQASIATIRLWKR